MSAKTSQLQIRVSPAEKAALKRLAAEAELSLSAYVLAAALPSSRRELEHRIDAFMSAPDRTEALADLVGFLRGLAPAEYSGLVADARLGEVPDLLKNYVAAAVEQEARRKGLEPPEWTKRVEILARPHFAPDLRGLRPHLMRTTSPAFKRRRAFIVVRGDERERKVRAAAGEGDASARFTLLDRELAAAGLDAEVCVVGGAVMRLAFVAAPPTRRPSAMFARPAALEDAESRIAARLDLPSNWVNSSVRAYLGLSGSTSAMLEGDHLRVFAAAPDYMLAMKVAALELAPDADQNPAIEADIRYLLRFLEARSADDAMVLLNRYLNERQRPLDLEDRLAAMLPYS